LTILGMKRCDRIQHYYGHTQDNDAQKAQIKRLACGCCSAEDNGFRLFLAFTLVSITQGFDSAN
jgi:hypothetical protein